MLQYTVPGGKKNRGLAVSQAYKHLVEDVTDEGLRQAHLMGWAVEMVHNNLTGQNSIFFLNFIYLQ